MKLILDLQLFAVQTTLLNSTGNDLSPEMKTFYDKTLIRLAEPYLVHDQFGQKRPIPKHGGKTIEFRKFTSLPKALTAITEGVTPNGNKLDVTAINATVAQYGDYIQQSDVLELTAIDNTILEATRLLASQAGRTLDTITRNALVTGTNVLYGGSGISSRANLTSSSFLTLDLVFKAATILKQNNTPTIDGSYVAIIHPSVAHDLMIDSKAAGSWIDVHKYAAPEAIYNGELGKIGNVRFVESTEAKIWNDNTCPVVSGTTYYSVYATLVFGANAYGVTEVEGGGLQHIVKQLGYGDDPLDQRSSIGWKALKCARLLVDEYLVRVETTSSFSQIDGAN